MIEVSARTSGYSSPKLNAPESLRSIDGLFSPRGDAHLGILTDINPRSSIFSDSHKDVWLLRDEGKRKHRRDNGAYTAVPESATLGYLLLGLVAVGFLGFRRSAWMRPI
jgi:hypothetical protein